MIIQVSKGLSGDLGIQKGFYTPQNNKPKVAYDPEPTLSLKRRIR